MSAPTDFDIVIIGAGLAGSSAAVALGRQGLRVALVDPRPVYPAAFKAEKIEPDQAQLFRSLGLMDGVLPHAARINTVREGHAGHILREVPIEQYGIFYQEMVNAVRRQVPAGVHQVAAKAERLETGLHEQTVILTGGGRLRTRLVILSSGTSGRLHEDLGIARRCVRMRHSLCSGFDVARTDAQPFDFDSLTYWADSLDDRIDYVTFFRMPGRMRVNMFSYREPKDPWVRELVIDAFGRLDRSIPRMRRVSGAWRATSKVENVPIDLYTTERPSLDGVVLIGDAFQSVCPATGTGVSKVLTDVHRLCMNHLPKWFATSGMSRDKIASFYMDPVKIECDRNSLTIAEHRRNFSTAPGFRWWIHRRKSYLQLALNGWRSKLPASGTM